MDADPDPDPVCHFGADAQNLENAQIGLIFHTFWRFICTLMRIKIRVQLITLMRIRILVVPYNLIRIFTWANSRRAPDLAYPPAEAQCRYSSAVLGYP
jgi:hypothetical protein